ncbi:MAG TPA: hypothetical protein EYP04_00115 [Anaerolineae bacterium]|nr:hypothetical protein [Anaerolineae bacterium]
MNHKVKTLVAISIAVVVLVAVLVTSAAAQTAFPQRAWPHWGYPGMTTSGRMMGDWDDRDTTVSPGARTNNWTWGRMAGFAMGISPWRGAGMGDWGPGAGCGWWGTAQSGTSLTLEQAVEAAENYIAVYGNPDLELAEVMEFTNNFYAQAREKSTGRYAFEILINRYSGSVRPEPGPNMMWNTKYGHMGGGMMGWWGGAASTGEMTVSPQQARNLAQRYLDAYYPGLEAEEEVDTFYGYYTIHTLQDGQIVGMLSVNGYSGQVWYHTWHGDFIGMTEHGE